jgi:hypothetical protein
MKYLAGILLAVSIFNAFVMWCMCAMGAREDRWMEELMRKSREKQDETERAE